MYYNDIFVTNSVYIFQTFISRKAQLHYPLSPALVIGIACMPFFFFQLKQGLLRLNLAKKTIKCN